MKQAANMWIRELKPFSKNLFIGFIILFKASRTKRVWTLGVVSFRRRILGVSPFFEPNFWIASFRRTIFEKPKINEEHLRENVQFDPGFAPDNLPLLEWDQGWNWKIFQRGGACVVAITKILEAKRKYWEHFSFSLSTGDPLSDH